MKSFQFFKIWKCFDKEREKTHMLLSMKKKNWEKLDFVLTVKHTIHLNGFNQLSDPVIWI